MKNWSVNLNEAKCGFFFLQKYSQRQRVRVYEASAGNIDRRQKYSPTAAKCAFSFWSSQMPRFVSLFTGGKKKCPEPVETRPRNGIRRHFHTTDKTRLTTTAPISTFRFLGNSDHFAELFVPNVRKQLPAKNEITKSRNSGVNAKSKKGGCWKRLRRPLYTVVDKINYV